MKNNVVLGLLWVSYGIVHSVLASDSVKKVFNTKYYRLIYNLIAIVLLIPILYFQLTVESKRLMEDSIFNQLLGGIMMSAGIFMMYISILILIIKNPICLKLMGFLNLLGIRYTQELCCFFGGLLVFFLPKYF
jgi:hypothetical protein